MMGIKIRSFSPLPRDVSLEELVPENHFYRRLEETLDLSFVRELVAPFYAGGGRPSVDPVVFFKLQLVLFSENMRSERQLMGVVADRLSLRWYLGYDLHEPLPDHSSLTRIRDRYGLPVFRRFFERMVEACVEAGLVRGDELFFDATKVRANADVDSLRSRSLVEDHLDGLFEEEAHEPDAACPDATGAEAPPAVELGSGIDEANARRGDWISRDGAQDRSFESGSRKRTSDSRISRTDPDASPMRLGSGETRLGYQAHYVVDGGKARVVLNALVTPSEVTENRPMLDLLWRTCFRWKLRPHHVTGDAKYGTHENVAGVERAGIRAYVAIPNFDFRRTQGGFFGPGHFRYDAGEDAYVCPAGEPMRRRARNSGPRGTMYRASAEACNACRLKERCTGSENGRTVYRPWGEEYYDRARAYRGIHPYEKALRKRKVWVEPLFAEAKDWHGLRRFRLRGLEKVNAEALLIASGQNVKRLLEFGRRGPRKMAQAGALRPPAPHATRAGTAARRSTAQSPIGERRGVSQRAGPFCSEDVNRPPLLMFPAMSCTTARTTTRM
jgi:transposase